jgi:hypothetical protein
MKRNSKRKAMGPHFATGMNGVLHGWSRLAGTTKATLFVGAKVGLSTGPLPEGRMLPEGEVIDAVVGFRGRQIGPAAGATYTIAKGRYNKKNETTYKVEFFPDEPLPTFKRNIKALAQEAAKRLGQRQVFVEMIVNGKTTTTYAATPTGAPNPKQWPKFCAWVRKNSNDAKRPGDECYEAPKPRRK